MLTLTFIKPCICNATGKPGFSWRVTRDWDHGNIHFGTEPETLAGGTEETREAATRAACAARKALLEVCQ